MKKPLEFGTHLLAAVAFTSPSAPTIQTDIPTVIRHSDRGTVAATSFIPYLDSVDIIDRKLITSAISSLAIAEPIQVERPTTVREEVIGQLRTWKFLGENWDGEGANIVQS